MSCTLSIDLVQKRVEGKVISGHNLQVHVPRYPLKVINQPTICSNALYFLVFT